MWYSEWLLLLNGTLETYYPFEKNSREFIISLTLLISGSVLVGKIITGLLCDSQRSIVMIFFGMISPFALAVVGYLAIKIHVNPMLPYDWMKYALQYSSAGLVAILSVIFVTPFFLGLGFIKSFFAMSLTYIVTIALVSYGTPFLNGIIFDKNPIPTPEALSQIEKKPSQNTA